MAHQHQAPFDSTHPLPPCNPTPPLQRIPPLPAASSRGGSPQWSDSLRGAPCTGQHGASLVRGLMHKKVALVYVSHTDVPGWLVQAAGWHTLAVAAACGACTSGAPPRCAPSPSHSSRPRSRARCSTSPARTCRTAGERTWRVEEGSTRKCSGDACGGGRRRWRWRGRAGWAQPRAQGCLSSRMRNDELLGRGGKPRASREAEETAAERHHSQ